MRATPVSRPDQEVTRRPADGAARHGGRARRVLVTGCAAVLVAVLAACSGGPSSTGGGDSDGGPLLADVTPVSDPKAVTGESTAVVADARLDPIAQNPAATLPATVTDTQGTTVTVTDTSRILALDIYGSTSRIVYELGLGDNLVGRDISSSYAEVSDLPLVTTNGHELNGEAILELAPTVIITDTSLGPWDVVLQMRDAGIPVVVVDSSRGMDNIGSLIQEVADALGVHDTGAKLAERTQQQVEAKVAEIAKIAPADGKKLRMVFLYVRGQAGIYYMFGKGSGADALIEALGGEDVATEIGWDGMRPVNDEGLVAAQPDLILMMTKGLESVGGVDGLLERLPAVANTPAGEHRRIVDMDDDEILSFGPTTADVLDALAVAVYAPQDAVTSGDEDAAAQDVTSQDATADDAPVGS